MKFNFGKGIEIPKTPSGMSHCDSFAEDDKRFGQFINLKNDATYIFCTDFSSDNVTEKCVFIVNSDGQAYDGTGKYLGKFRMDGKHHWEFHDEKSVWQLHEGYLLAAEIKLFKLNADIPR